MNNFDEDQSVYNGQFEVDILIDRPVALVFRQYVDVASWVTNNDIEYLYGGPGIVGSIRRVSWRQAKELGLPPAHYHYCKIIKVVPERQHLIKTYSEKGGSYGWKMTSFDDSRFIEVGGTTKVVFNVFAEIRSDAADTLNIDASREGMFRNLCNLKRILESC
jgi:hypothetical protein